MSTPTPGDPAPPSPEERHLSAEQRARMRELAGEYAARLPGRDSEALAAGLKARLVYTDLGERDGAYDPEHGVILVNRRASPQRQRFTLAHEVSHALLLGDDDLLSELHDRFEDERLEQAIETLCNVGAATILMPPDLLNEVLRRYGPTGRAIHELSRRADVSASSAMYALADEAHGPIIFAICSRVGGKKLEEGASGRQRQAVLGPGRPVVVRASAETAEVRYSLRPGTRVPDDHLITVALDTECHQGGQSYVPFRSGRRMPAFLDAYPDGRRGVLVSFRLEDRPSPERPSSERAVTERPATERTVAEGPAGSGSA
ncbi:ImmA/IrrE family metallo-endopeptidase [Deinococcus aquiradiocola]|uniref:Radiation response metalloprotease IrrE n=1 Tax=Deinococcus aquiradiocola TaxID=393059 RepID=A0A917PR36_9DEIO|nr:ImmA/IrrE family metallo-endopeptidase [Deinococcus aquiradiocola]GGJ88808.1 radiation response metalloprotease IrrE [Deinococcus aquiradiocola]